MSRRSEKEKRTAREHEAKRVRIRRALAAGTHPGAFRPWRLRADGEIERRPRQ